MLIPFRKFETKVTPSENGFVVSANPIGSPDRGILLGNCMTQRLANELAVASTDELITDCARAAIAPILAHGERAKDLAKVYGIEGDVASVSTQE
mgnify:CR=1 FL=1